MEVNGNIINFGVNIISTSQETFYSFSFTILIIMFIIKLIFNKSSFEYLKITTTIIIFTVSLHFAFLEFKDNQIFRAQSRIISVQSSRLSDIEKEKYIQQAQNVIKQVEDQKITRIGNMIYGIGRYFLIGIFIILLRDLLPIRLFKKT